MGTESQRFGGASFPVRNLFAGDESLDPVERHSRLKRGYLMLALAVLAVYVVAAVYFLRNPGFPSDGPGDFAHANLGDDAIPRTVLDVLSEEMPNFNSMPLAGVEVQDAVGGPVWVLYSLREDGSVFDALVLDSQTLKVVKDADRIKPLGAWLYIGLVKAFDDWATGFFALLGILLAVMRWAPGSQVRGKLARREPRRWIKAVFAARPVVGVGCATVVGVALIWVAPGWNRHQRWLWMYRCITAYVVVIGIYIVLLAIGSSGGDSASFAALMTIGGGSAIAWLYGWRLLRPSGARLAGIEDGAEPVPSIVPQATETATAGAPKPAIGMEPPPRASTVPTAPPSSPPVSQAPARTGGAPTMVAPTVAASADDDFKVVPPFECPTFDDVGGMESVKQQLRDTVGLVLAFPGEALELKVAFNGILLFGPPGTGKTFMAKAAAGEYGCNFLSLGSVELTSSFRGESAKKIARAFDVARANVPVIMFFDEFDAIGTRRDDTPGSSDDLRSLTQLLRSLEGVRDSPEVIVVAATNHFDQLDPAVIRPGRFDRRIRVDMPDSAARASIFEAQLSGRPTAEDIDVDELARLAEGLSAAAIADIVNTSALNVLADLREGSETSEITQVLLEATTRGRGGKDRPSSESWSWDSLILPEHTKRELQELQKLIEDSERARQLGIAPPSGALLYGPPGTGKNDDRARAGGGGQVQLLSGYRFGYRFQMDGAVAAQRGAAIRARPGAPAVDNLPGRNRRDSAEQGWNERLWLKYGSSGQPTAAGDRRTRERPGDLRSGSDQPQAHDRRGFASRRPAGAADRNRPAGRGQSRGAAGDVFIEDAAERGVRSRDIDRRNRGVERSRHQVALPGGGDPGIDAHAAGCGGTSGAERL